MIDYKLLAALLDYPTAHTARLLDQLDGCGAEAETLRAARRFADSRRGKKLIDWQQEYVQTFDDSPATTLYLFDHVYGSSRQRGEAMSDLVDMYRARGLEIADGELPDYLPVLLEYASLLDNPQQADDYMADVAPILADIAKALDKLKSPYLHLVRELQRRARGGRAHPAPPPRQRRQPDGRGDDCAVGDCASCQSPCGYREER